MNDFFLFNWCTFNLLCFTYVAGQLTRAAVELAKMWRMDKYLRRLDVSLLLRFYMAPAHEQPPCMRYLKNIIIVVLMSHYYVYRLLSLLLTRFRAYKSLETAMCLSPMMVSLPLGVGARMPWQQPVRSSISQIWMP